MRWFGSEEFWKDSDSVTILLSEGPVLPHLIATRGEQGFAWRAGEITRLEAFSDAVLAFAVTLLVVSLEVPHTFGDLIDAMRGFPAFAVCFAMLAQVWYEHSRFFRRYGLQDAYTVFLNCVLLFVVLFYVYPLKFLFTYLLGELSHGMLMAKHGAHGLVSLEAGDSRFLMAIYGLGFAAVFGVFFLLYLYAYRQRRALQLDEVETTRTLRSLITHGGMAGIGVTSAGLAMLLPSESAGLAGFLYFGIGILHWITGAVYGKRERLIRERKTAAPRAL